MVTYEHIEDYLEVIAGKRNHHPATLLNAGFVFASFEPLINLARYDVNFLDSVTDATLGGSALTDRQADLAVRLILKYRKQLHAKGIDVTPCETPKYRRKLRYIDRSKHLDLINNTLHLRFPYDSNMISELRSFLKDSQGGGRFNKETKTWEITASEYNINWLHTWCSAKQFTVEARVHEVMQEITEVEKQPYHIRLERQAGQLTITNAESSLLEWLAEQGIALEDENLLKLADLSSVLGYDLAPELIAELDGTIGADITVLVLSRNYDLVGEQRGIERIIRYARLVNRLPIIVFDPSTHSKMFFRNVEKEDTLIWTHRPISDRPISLLLSYNGMMAGVDKSRMLQQAQKVIYFNQKLSP